MRTEEIAIVCIFVLCIILLSMAVERNTREIKRLKEKDEKNWKAHAEIDDTMEKCMDGTSKIIDECEKLTKAVHLMDEKVDDFREAAQMQANGDKAFAEALDSLMNFQAPNYNHKKDGDTN